MYNVTGAAIKKAAIRHGIDLPKRRKINPNEVFRKNLIGKSLLEPVNIVENL